MPELKTILRPSATVERQIAKRVAALREEGNLILLEIATRTGLSVSYLDRVERRKTPINIASLEKAADRACCYAGQGTARSRYFRLRMGNRDLRRPVDNAVVRRFARALQGAAV